jgi:hypothetical protein
MMAYRAAVLSGCLLSACGEGTSAPMEGFAELRFSVTNGVRQSPNLVDPLVGTIYGNVFLAKDVTLFGPREGAEQFGYVEMLDVDLQVATESDVWPLGPLPVGRYMFLGFFDVNGNGHATKEPDPGDPVTLPVNAFDIEADQTTTLTVDFDLVLN